MSLTAPARDRDTLSALVTVTFDERAIGAYYTRDAAVYIYDIYLCDIYVTRFMTAKMTTMTVKTVVVLARIGITGCNGLIIISMPRVHRV